MFQGAKEVGGYKVTLRLVSSLTVFQVGTQKLFASIR